jgi:O-antigen/teichoic acid export membrane protein
LVRRNIIANYLGRGWTIGIGIIVVPIYIKILGIEAYGLIGFYVSLTVMLGLLDLGMSSTLVREAAIWGKERSTENVLTNFPDLFKSIEIISRIAAAFFIVVIILLSNWLAAVWLDIDTITIETVIISVSLMGVMVSSRWAASVYRSALTGFQEQVWLNGFDAGIATARSIGVVIVLVYFSPTVTAFFLYQLGLSFIEYYLISQKAWNRVGYNYRDRAKFSTVEIRRVWRYAGGVALISILGALISQADKLVLPGILSLKEYGYYAVASIIGRSISQFAAPITTAVRPRLIELVASQETKLLPEVYHKGCQALSLVVIPITVWLALFSEQIVFVWSGDAALSQKINQIVSLLAIGTMLNALIHIPYSIQLSYGWLRLALVINLVLVVLIFPMLIYGVINYGVEAAAWAWVILNSCYVVFTVSIMHRRFLIGEATTWYVKNFFIPLFTATVLAVMIKIQDIGILTRVEWGIALPFIYLIILLATSLSMKYPRVWFKELLLRG